MMSKNPSLHRKSCFAPHLPDNGHEFSLPRSWDVPEWSRPAHRVKTLVWLLYYGYKVEVTYNNLWITSIILFLRPRLDDAGTINSINSIFESFFVSIFDPKSDLQNHKISMGIRI